MHSPHHVGATKIYSWNYHLWNLYQYGSKFNFFGYSNSDWVGSTDDRKITSGSVFKFGLGVILWTSKKQ